MQSMYAARGRLAALQRHRSPDDPEIAKARAQLREAMLADQIRREVDSAPPLTADQRARLAILLLGGEAA